MQQRSVRELYEVISNEPQVWVRTAVILPQQPEEWTLQVLDVTAGEPPPNWSTLEWVYPRVVLRAQVLPGQTVVDWMRQESIQLGSVRVPLPPLSDTSLCSIQRRSSGSSGFHGRFAWPYEEWTIPFPFPTFSSVSDELIGEGDTPSFISPNIAVAAMLGLSLPAGGGFDAKSLIFRQQSRAFRITRVHVMPAVVAIDIEGDDVVDVSLELASNLPGPMTTITTSGNQTIELPKPYDLPDSSWVLARRSGRWLDRRFLTYTATDQAADVDYYVEPLSQLESIIAGGEGPTTEFKREIPEQTIRMMKSIAAFANGSGGVLLIGVENDGTIAGVDPELFSAKGLDTLTNKIRNWVSPVPDFGVESISTGDDLPTVVAVSVIKGSQPPYGAGTTNDTLTYFIRRGATTFAAAPDQVRELVRLNPPLQSEPFGSIFGAFD
jgi:Putative DNA-binding domain